MQRQYGDAGWLQHVADFARPFRMPDFFLISGLFLARGLTLWSAHRQPATMQLA